MKPLVLSGKNKIVKDAASGEKSKTKAQIENGSGRSIYIYIYIHISYQLILVHFYKLYEGVLI